MEAIKVKTRIKSNNENGKCDNLNIRSLNCYNVDDNHFNSICMNYYNI